MRTRRTRAAAAAKPTRRLPLGSLRVFVAVARHASFSRAADALGVTTSAASLQVRALEQYLGRPLLRRNGREVLLTAEGEALLPRVQRALADLESAIDAARAPRGTGPLRVTMLASFLQQWLLPRLPRFEARHPGIDLHLHTSIDVVDFVREDVQAGVRMGRGDWPGVHAEKLLDEWLLPVCTPATFACCGTVAGVDDLTRHTLLHSTSEPWTSWLLGGRVDVDHAAAGRGARFDDSVTLIRAAAQGHGTALARWSLVAAEIAAGTLVAAGRAVRFERSYWFVMPPRSKGLPAVEALRAWLFEEARDFGAPPGAQRA